MRRNQTDLRKKIQDFSYSMSDVIHQGTSSKVYKGTRDPSREPVAIKVINIQSFKSKQDKKALDLEVEAIKKLNHPNILKCLEVYTTSNNCYIITEYCEGGNLKDLLLKKKSKLKEEEIESMFRGIFKGYKYLYSKGLVHRNLEPSNILLKNGQCKIADFGMASNETNYQIKGGGAILRSLYHNPDDLKSGILRAKSDIYSLGVILYELFHKRLPFESKNKSPAFDQIASSAKDLIKKALGLDGHSLLSIEEFFNHPYINQINYGQNPTSNKIFKEDYRSIPLTKVYSTIQNKPNPIELEKIKQSNKIKAENAITGQLNLIKFLFKLFEFLPKCDLQFVVVKHLLSVLQALNQCSKLQNPYDCEYILNFFSSPKSAKFQQTIKQYTKRYNFLLEQLNQYISKGTRNKLLLPYFNPLLERSQGFVVCSIPIVIEHLKLTMESCKTSKSIKSMKDEDTFDGQMLQKILGLDYTITYYQLICLCVSNWNDLNSFSEESRIGDIVSLDPSSLTKADLKDIENKMKALGIS